MEEEQEGWGRRAVVVGGHWLWVYVESGKREREGGGILILLIHRGDTKEICWMDGWWTGAKSLACVVQKFEQNSLKTIKFAYREVQ